VPHDLHDKRWLDALLDDQLARYDRDAARARLPAEIRLVPAGTSDLAPAARILVARSLRRHRLDHPVPSPQEAFLDEVRGHVELALDLALLTGEPFVRAGRRAELAAFLAAAGGDNALAVRVEPHEPGGASDREVERALRVAGQALQERFFPPGDPVGGLPLHAGAVAVFRRHLARVVMGFLRSGRLDARALARHRAYAAQETALLAETLAALLATGRAPDARARAVRTGQIGRLGLPRDAARAVRRLIQAPRAAAAIAAAAPEPVCAFLVEQILLAQLRAKLSGEGPARFVEAFAAAAKLDAQAIAAAQVEAAAQHGDHELWFEAIGGANPEWQRIADQWEEVADHVVERVGQAVTENLEAIVTEVRQTGELGTLLAKAAGGHPLSADERRKVKRQLIDLAKAVPALAIFAAPGGMLLLPLLAKLLPFNVLPSAWDRTAANSERKR
jgi:hypothetical protein